MLEKNPYNKDSGFPDEICQDCGHDLDNLVLLFRKCHGSVHQPVELSQ